MKSAESKTKLVAYKAYLDHNYSELLEMPEQQEGMLNHMLDVIRGEPHVQMNNYLKQLQSTLNPCEAAR